MIASANDIASAIEYLTTEQETTAANTMDNHMSSSYYNAVAKDIENRLNILYEKIRVLEDLDRYAREYCREKIEEKEKIFKERLKIIEDVTDVYRDTESVSILVPFISSSEIIRDRDGTVLPTMTVLNKMLIPNGSVLGKAQIDSISVTSNRIPVSNNYSYLEKGEAGLSYYVEDEPVQDGIVEECTVSLKSLTHVNSFSVTPLNCEIEDVRAITSEKTEESIDLKGSYMEPRDVLGFKFKLKATNYEQRNILADDGAYRNSEAFTTSPAEYMRKSDNVTIKSMEKSVVASTAAHNIENIKMEYYAWQNEKAVNNKRNSIVVMNPTPKGGDLRRNS